MRRIPRAIIAVFIIFLGSIVLPITINLVTGGTAPPAFKPYARYYWPVIGASFLVLAVYALPKIFKRQPAPAMNMTPHPSNRAKALSEIQSNINSRLANSLNRLAKITLNMEDASELIAKPSHLIVQSSTETTRTSTLRRDIMKTFSDYDESILILGEPGSGKSTTLLDLAQQLHDRAVGDEEAALPIVLDLARWAARTILPPAATARPEAQQNGDTRDKETQSSRTLASRRQTAKPESGLGRDIEFNEWLIREMHQQYRIPRRVGDMWLKDRRVILLLDGLDEMPPPARDECAKTLNKFIDAFNMPGIAITCRLQDYQAIAAKLTMQGAVKIQPLTRGQITRYFEAAGEGLRGVRAALDADRTLWELLDSPLMLSIMAIAYHDREINTNQLSGTISERRNKLTESYVMEVLTRRQAPVASFSISETTRWLAVIGHAASIGNLMPLGPFPPGMAMRWRYSAPEAAVRLMLSTFFPWLVGLVCAVGIILPVGLTYGPLTADFAVIPALVFQLSYLLFAKPVLRRRYRRATLYPVIRWKGLAVGTTFGLACFGVSIAFRGVTIPSTALRSFIVAGVLIGGLGLVFRLEDSIPASLIEASYWLAIALGASIIFLMYIWHPNAQQLGWFVIIGFCSALTFVVIGSQLLKLMDRDTKTTFLPRRPDWISTIIPLSLVFAGSVIVAIINQRSTTEWVVALVGIASGIVYAVLLGPFVSFLIGLFVSPASLVMSCMDMLPLHLKKFLYYAQDRSLLYRKDRNFSFIHAIFQGYFLKVYQQLTTALDESTYPPKPKIQRLPPPDESGRGSPQPKRRWGVGGPG